MKNFSALIIALIAAIVAGYFIVAAIVKLITLCFGLVFTWKIATGVWLILLLFNCAIVGCKR